MLNALYLRRATLVSLYLDDEIGEPGRTVEYDLVRHARRNSNDVSSGNFLPDAALNRAIALFVGLGDFPADHGSPRNQSGRARFHDENVGLSFVPFHHAVSLSAREHEIV